MLQPAPHGNYSFLPGIGPYSRGVIADTGYTIEQVRLDALLPWRAGFDLIDAHLNAAGRSRAALCAIALRSPAPFTFEGFNQFNAGYIEVLRSWGLFVGDVNPLARTNVAPEINPPREPSLYSFAYTVAGDRRAFVVAGAGELPEGSLEPKDVVKGSLAAKAQFVLHLMEERLHGLGVDWNAVTQTDIYTVHDLNALMRKEILPRIGPAARHGVTWHYTRPPIVTIEYEMDLLCVRSVNRPSR